jgi:predicted N-acetyltransferase YhbS
VTDAVPHVRIRAERSDDVDAFRHVHAAAFNGTAEGRIVDDLRGTQWSIAGGSLVAVDQHHGVVGHLLVSRGDLVDVKGEARAIGVIGPVGVLPEWQGQGIGASLMRAAIELAESRSLPLVVLLGHATYYPRFGFEPARAIGIEPPRPWPDESWLALRLPGWTPELRGTVHYPPAFPVD